MPPRFVVCIFKIVSAELLACSVSLFVCIPGCFFIHVVSRYVDTIQYIGWLAGWLSFFRPRAGLGRERAVRCYLSLRRASGNPF
jgi:hypothetical protein